MINFSLNFYVQFHIKHTRYVLAEFFLAYRHFLIIVFAVGAPVIVGILAIFALPLLYAPSLSTLSTVSIFLIQTVVVSIPVIVFRQKILPSEIIFWLRSLPISISLAWAANAVVSAIILFPFGLAYFISLAIWFYQWPIWLHSFWKEGLVLTVLSFLGTWLISSTVLILRYKFLFISSVRYSKQSIFLKFFPTLLKVIPLPSFYYWYRLYWCAFWSSGSFVGVRLISLLFMTIGFGISWIVPNADLVLFRSEIGFVFSFLLIFMADRARKAVLEQTRILIPVISSWPVNPSRLKQVANFFALLPGVLIITLLSLYLFLTHEVRSLNVGITYIFFATSIQFIAIYCNKFSIQGRVIFNLISVLVLSAIGSLMWN